jgi:hypothetical protein
MQENSHPQPKPFTVQILRIYFLVAALQGGATLQSLIRIPTDAKNRFLFGLSALRLGMALGVLLFILIFMWLALETWRYSPRFVRWVSSIERSVHRQRFWGRSIGILVFVLLSGSYLLLQTPEILEPYSLAYFERLYPLLLWAVLLSAQTLITLPLLRDGLHIRTFLPQSINLRWTFVILGFFLLAGLWIARSRIGLEPDSIGWNALGAPLLETQVWIAWVVGVSFLGLVAWWKRRSRKLDQNSITRDPAIRIDIVISLLLWLVASIYWLSIPLPGSWFVTEPAPPNHAYYPNSDALIYDTTGQSMLVGEPFKSWDIPYPRRPMLALFFAFMDMVSHQNYETAIMLQVALLALFPVIIYFLTRRLGNRLAGLIMGILVILREGNAIRLSGNITISHSKLLMADFPTALGIALFTYLLVSWLQKPDSHKVHPLISGGVIGIFMLIRPEVAVLLLIAFALMGYRWMRQQPFLWKNSALILAGVFLVITPWIWRNWQMTGKIFLDNPDYRIDYFLERFNLSPGENGIESTDDTFGFATNNRKSPRSASLSGLDPFANISGNLSSAWINMFSIGKPATNSEQAGSPISSLTDFIPAHYVHSQIQSVLYLPATFRLPDTFISFIGHRSLPQFLEDCCSAKNYILRLPYWDKNWEGRLAYQSIIPILLNLFFVSAGLRIAWVKHRFTGLLPAGFLIFYLLINAVARTSGGRYILPVDWIPLMYFAIGLGYSTVSAANILSGNPSIARILNPDNEYPPALGNKKSPRPFFGFLAISAGLFFIGSLLPLAERVVPQRYPDKGKQEVLKSLLDTSALDGVDPSALERTISVNDQVLIGRALYPRFYKADTGAPGHPTTDTWAESARPSFYTKEFPRFGFYLVGPQNSSIILPTLESPDRFPNASDVIVLGCPGEEYFDAWAVAIFDAQHRIESVFTRSPLPERLSCPLPEP